VKYKKYNYEQEKCSAELRLLMQGIKLDFCNFSQYYYFDHCLKEFPTNQI